jgi:hypothetical protein
MSWLINPSDPEQAVGLADTDTDLKKAMRRPNSCLTGEAWSPVLTNRQRVLLHTQPLILMQHFPGSRDEDQQHYDVLCLTIKVFDVIIEQSGFGSEVVRDTIAESLRPLLVALDEEANVSPDTVRHDRVVDRVLSSLKNEQQRGQPFEVEYQEFDEKGKPRRRRLSFRLVKEAHGYTGQIVLKLSSEAINLFLNAFGLDIEDAQAANEAVVQSQLARGKFNEAIQSAQNARGQSMRYEDKIMRMINETKRDIDRVDWRGEAHEMLVEASTHVDSRLRIEQNIIDSAQEKLDLLDDSDAQQLAVAEVIRLMKDCRSRHLSLHKRLMSARTEFLEQQARQSFRESLAFEPIDLLESVLRPLLLQPVERAVAFTDGTIHSLLGPSPPPVLSIARLVSWQLQPRRLYTPGETAMVQDDFADMDGETQRFDAFAVEQMQKAFAKVNSTVLLSTLIEELTKQECPPTVRDLIVLETLRSYDQDIQGESQLQVDLAEAAGLRCNGYFGDDLWIAPRKDVIINA